MVQTYRVETDCQHEAVDRELITPPDPRAGLISINQARLSGTPCFEGTRVPVRHLFEYIEAGENLNDFLEGFPGVSRNRALEVLQLAVEQLIGGAPPK